MYKTVITAISIVAEKEKKKKKKSYCNIELYRRNMYSILSCASDSFAMTRALLLIPTLPIVPLNKKSTDASTTQAQTVLMDDVSLSWKQISIFRCCHGVPKEAIIHADLD